MSEAHNAKRLFLFDAMALIYRAHFALIRSPRFTSGGLCTSAVFGLANTLFDILNREKPTHLAIVFDTAKPTHRHDEFKSYKAQRQAIPEDLAVQLPYVDRLIAGLNISTVRVPGFEADDIIGALARQAELQGFSTWMVTPDKDFDQLVNENTVVYHPGRQGSSPEQLRVQQVLEKWGVRRVEQVVDILGLMGDSSDNIPGVPGIGEKTAQKLISEFDSIENLLANTGRVKGKTRELLETHAEQALLSKRLATIICDVPVQLEFDALLRKDYVEKPLQALFVELEFEVLGKRIFGPLFSANPALAGARQKQETEIQSRLFIDPVEEKTIQTIAHDYRIVRTPSERSQLISLLLAQSAVCISTKTSALNPRTAPPMGIAFSFAPHSAYFVQCPTDSVEALAVLREFREVLESDAIEKVGHNLKHEAMQLRWHGLELRGRLMDIRLAHAMKEPEMRNTVDYLSKLYLGYIPIAVDRKNMQELSLQQIADWACEDVDVMLQLSRVIGPDIETRQVAQVCHEVEFPLISVLADMEYHGINLDTAALLEYSQLLQRDIEQLRADIFKAAGKEFNIESPKQLGVVLYEELKLAEQPKKTDTGQFTTRETELLRLAGQHRIVRDVLDYRNSVKMKSNYVDQLPGHVDSTTRRLHTYYDQDGTSTGRMQSGYPNLQTIPVRKERGREIRAAFIPRNDDYLLLSADYSQIELRIMAELSGDASMYDAFASGTDIHTVTAANVYKVGVPEVTREMRDKAKAVNFGIIYGISAFGLQQRLNISRDEARGLIETYFQKYPGVRKYIDETVAFARAEGYVKTRTGRRRYLRDINSRNHSLRNAAERLAMNSPIQGTAADMLKLAMIKVHQALRAGRFQTKMLLTVHDEIVFDLYKSEQTTVMPLIEECMKTALPMKVPIAVEMGVGRNWLEAH